MKQSEENPYAPPRHDDAPPQSGRDDRPYALASRGQRLLSAVIDTIFNLALVFGMHVATALVNDRSVPSFMELYGPGALRRGGLQAWALSLAPFAIMAALIARRSQSIGKIVMLTRIVTLDGRPAGFYRGFVLRTLPLTGIALIPSFLMALGADAQSMQPVSLLTGLVSLVDALMIFGDDRRCLHDRIAGTVVIKAGTERPATGAPRRKKKKRKAAAPTEGDAS